MEKNFLMEIRVIISRGKFFLFAHYFFTRGGGGGIDESARSLLFSRLK